MLYAPYVNTDLSELKERALTLLPILRRQARRPYIVEFAGTPKAGKTSSLAVLRRFLKDCGYRVHEMRERAADCPIAMKGHFFFNTWTTTTMLAAMIENLESEADVVLLDRGVFDALVWLESQNDDNQLSTDEYNSFRNFILLDRWRTRTDLTFVFKVEPGVSMRRENKDLLIPRTGSIMGEPFLTRYNNILNRVRSDVNDSFSIIDIDTTHHLSVKDTTNSVAEHLLESMKRWADPEIAAIPRAAAEELFPDQGQGIRDIAHAMNKLEETITFRTRSQLAESDLVGLVSAGVLRHDGKMLLLHRGNEKDEKRQTFGPYVLWKGCHIKRHETSTLMDTAKAALKDRLKEDFHLAKWESDPAPRFLVWSRKSEKIAQHLAVLFDLNIPHNEAAQSLASKVFKRERDRATLGNNRFVSAADLNNEKEVELEPWSQEILKKELAIPAPK